MIPPASASDRLTSILGTSEWAPRRGERAGESLGRERSSARDDSTKSVWSGTVALTRRGRARAVRSGEAVDETAGLVARASFGSGNSEVMDGTQGASSAQASDAEVSDMDELAPPARRERRTSGEAARGFGNPRTMACQLVAQAPPVGANIPGTARGEGYARASAAGNALPEIINAEWVLPGDAGWPEVWDPVALLRLFPLSAHHAATFNQISAVLAGVQADDGAKKHAKKECIPAAARMELPDGYVVYIISDEGLPDIVRDAVLMKNASGGAKRSAEEKMAPLWAIIQSIEPLDEPQPPASVPTPDTKPTRGILRGWVPPPKEPAGRESSRDRATRGPEQEDAARMPEELSGVHPSAETTDEEKSLSSAHEMTSGVEEREGMGTVTPILSEETSELTSGTSEVDRVTIKIGGDDELDDWLSPPLVRRKRRLFAGERALAGSGSDNENSDDSSGREFAKLKRTATSPAASPSSSEGEEELVPMEGQHEIPTSAAALAQVISPEQRVPCIPLTGLRYMLLGFELNHPHVVYLINSLAEEGATHVDIRAVKPEHVDLIVLHPPFLQLLSAPQFPMNVADFIRTRHTRFALGLRHLELCLEYKRQLDPRLETAEVFPEGVLVVMDDTALINDEDALHRVVRLLAQAAAASAACSAAKGIFHYGQDGTRENPPWPWAIKVANSTIQKLMMIKLKMMQTNTEKAWKIEAMIKALHAYKHAGDRAGRGARVMGITWEEASHQPVEDPPQAVRDAVKIASRHVSMCRAVFMVSEDPKTLAAAKGQRSILSGNVSDACEFLTQIVREMWAETKAARTGMSVYDRNFVGASEPSASEVNSDARDESTKLADEQDEVSDGRKRSKEKKVVKFPTMIDDGGRSTRSRGRYSPPPSPTRTNSGRTGDDTSKDTSKTSTGDAPNDGEETAQSPVAPSKKLWRQSA